MPTDIASIADTTLIARSHSVLTSDVGGEVLMMNIKVGRYFGLDDIGSDIWHRLETPCTFGALVAALARDYKADQETIAADLKVLLGKMIESDTITLD